MCEALVRNQDVFFNTRIFYPSIDTLCHVTSHTFKLFLLNIGAAYIKHENGREHAYTLVHTMPYTHDHKYMACVQSNLVSEYTWGPSELLLTISSTC